MTEIICAEKQYLALLADGSYLCVESGTVSVANGGTHYNPESAAQVMVLITVALVIMILALTRRVRRLEERLEAMSSPKA